MPVRHPITGAIGDARILVYSTDSKPWRAYVHKALRDRVMKGDLSDAKPDEVMEQVVALTCGWEGLTIGGKPFEYTPDNARQLYELCPWLADQVNRFAADRSKFMGEPSPTSTGGRSKSSGSKRQDRAG